MKTFIENENCFKRTTINIYFLSKTLMLKNYNLKN